MKGSRGFGAWYNKSRAPTPPYYKYYQHKIYKNPKKGFMQASVVTANVPAAFCIHFLQMNLWTHSGRCINCSWCQVHIAGAIVCGFGECSGMGRPYVSPHIIRRQILGFWEYNKAAGIFPNEAGAMRNPGRSLMWAETCWMGIVPRGLAKNQPRQRER